MMLRALLYQCVGNDGEPLEVIETEATRETALSSIDDSVPIVIIAGLALNRSQDGALTELLSAESNMPFVDFFCIGSLVQVGQIDGLTVVKPYTEDTTTIQEAVRVFTEHKGLFTLKMNPDLERNVDLLAQYYRYYFRDNNDAYYATSLNHVSHALGLYASEDLSKIALDKLFHSNKTYHDIITHGMNRQTAYVNSQVRTVEWAMIPTKEGDFLTLGVAHGSQYKNEIAHALMKQANTNKVAIIVLEERFGVIMTIRTRGVSAVTIGKLVDPHADGLYSATTVFARFSTLASQVTEVFKKVMNENQTF